MEKIYRVTPLRGKWIVQRKADKKQCGKSFALKSEAAAYELELLAKAPTTNGVDQSCNTYFHEGYQEFVKYKFDQAAPGSRFNKRSAKFYDYDYRLRISKYMPNVLLSQFKQKAMRTYLDNCHANKVAYKTLKNSVAAIKMFLKHMAVEEKNPCLDILQLKITDYRKVVPDDDDLFYEKETEMLMDEEVKKILNLFYEEAPTNRDSAYTFTIMPTIFMFGLRVSEVLGLKRGVVDLENNLLHIKGIYIQEQGGFLNRTKNRGSRRSIELDQYALRFFNWWFDYLDKHHKYATYLFPSTKNDGPVGYKYVRALFWKAYARMGLAEIQMRRDGHPKIIKSLVKGSPTRWLRHRFCNRLIEAMNSNKLLTVNYVKQSAGHTMFKTTAERYGNKPVRGTAEERAARAAIKGDALKTNLIPKF